MREEEDKRGGMSCVGSTEYQQRERTGSARRPCISRAEQNGREEKRQEVKCEEEERRGTEMR
jgi:hypothetical protein